MSPNYTKTIICLANSRKLAGRCIAGKEFTGDKVGGWIRPVSGTPTGEVSEEDRRFQSGQDPKLLDLVRIPLIGPRPHGFQAENHLIDADYYWTKTGSVDWATLKDAIDPAGGALWDNSSSSYNGICDRVEVNAANQFGSSLYLIQVKDLAIRVTVEGAAFGNGKRKVRGRFSLNGANYLLAVTDPVVERQYLASQDGEFSVGRAILCVGLGEPYEGYAYKLIAGVFLKS